MSAKLFLFGQFRWELSTGAVVAPMRDKTQALVAYIALSGNGTVSRRQVANLLWGEGRDPGASLRQSIREIKDMEALKGSDLFSTDKKYLTLDLNRLWVDVRLATKCAQTFNTGLANQLLECKLGPLLQDCNVEEEAFDDWLISERSRRENDLNFIFEQYLDTVNLSGKDFILQKRLAAALLTVDSANEIAHRTIMNAHFNEGDKASALRQFELCKETMLRELGVDPSEETKELAAQIGTNAKIESKPEPAEVLSGTVLKDPTQLINPVVQVDPFIGSLTDDIIGYFAKTLHADICEQLARNRRYSIRDTTPPLFDIPSTQEADFRSVQPANYIVRGSVLPTPDKLTFLVQLSDGQLGEVLWMTRLTVDPSKNLEEASEAALLAAVEMIRYIELQEAEKANNTEDGLLTARQCVLRAVSIMFKFSAEAVARADRYLQRAILLNPQYPEAYAWLAFLKSIEVGQGFTDDADAVRDEIGALVRHAIELSPHDDIILAIAGHLEAFIHHDFESALEFFERALKANPNCAYAWGFNAITNCYIGKPNEALQMLQKCRHIMPFDPHPYYFDTARCIASMLAEKYDDAVRIGQQVLRNNPNFHANYRPLISSLGHLGRYEEASPVVEEFAKYQPDFSVSWHLANYPPLDEDKTESYIMGLRKAGVAEE